MDQMDPTPLLLAVLVPGALALALACSATTAVLWRALRGSTPLARLGASSLGSLGLVQAALWLLMPRWWRDSPGEHLVLVLLVQAVVTAGFAFLGGAPRGALPSSPQ